MRCMEAAEERPVMCASAELLLPSPAAKKPSTAPRVASLEVAAATSTTRDRTSRSRSNSTACIIHGGQMACCCTSLVLLLPVPVSCCCCCRADVVSVDCGAVALASMRERAVLDPAGGGAVEVAADAVPENVGRRRMLGMCKRLGELEWESSLERKSSVSSKLPSRLSARDVRLPSPIV